MKKNLLLAASILCSLAGLVMITLDEVVDSVKVDSMPTALFLIVAGIILTVFARKID